MVQLTKNNFNSFLIYNIMDNINRFIQFVYNKKQFVKMKETFKNTVDFAAKYLELMCPSRQIPKFFVDGVNISTLPR